MTVEATDGLYIELDYFAAEENGVSYFAYVAEVVSVAEMSSNMEAAIGKIAQAAASINSLAGLTTNFDVYVEIQAALSVTTDLVAKLNKVAINRIVWTIQNESRQFVIQKES
jgi:hypothetical protein